MVSQIGAEVSLPTFFVRHFCSPKESRAAEAVTTQKRV